MGKKYRLCCLHYESLLYSGLLSFMMSAAVELKVCREALLPLLEEL